MYKAKLADELRARGLYSLVPVAAWQKSFVVDIEAVEDGRSVVAYLAPYVHRVAISDHRIAAVTDDSVIYRYKPTKSLVMQSRKVSGQQFVSGFAQHILPTGFHKVRHYGWMNSTSKMKLEEIRIIVWMALGWIYWLASGHARQAKPVNRPQLRCAACGGTMRVLLIINEAMPQSLLEFGLAYLDSS